MMDIWLLGLLGAGLLGALLLSDDDDGSDGHDDGDENLGEEIDWKGSSEIEGTDLNDTVIAREEVSRGDLDIQKIDLKGGNDTAKIEASTGILDMGDGNDTLTFGTDKSFLVFGEIDMGDGDDVAIIDAASGGVVKGGAGNDRLDVFGTMKVEGGSGNDTITGALLGAAYGGDGDDVLNLQRPFGSGRSVHMLGGNGNDTLQASVTLGDTDHPYDEGSWVQMTGDAGQDSFELAVKVGEMTRAEYDDLIADHGAVNEENLPTIWDFNPAEDSITVEIDTTGTTVDRDVTITRHVQVQQPDGSYLTRVEFQVPAAGGMVKGATTLTIHSAVAFDLSVLNITVDGSPMAMPKAA